MTKRSTIRSQRAVVLAASSAAGALSVVGCLLTSSFDNVAGIRPEDAAPPNDAAAEAGDEAGDASDGASLPFSCATQVPAHFVCSDFDEGSLTAGGWALRESLGGTARLDTMQSSSPPGALLSKLPAISDSTTSSGILSQSLKGLTPKAVHLAFDMRIGACTSMGGNGSITLAVIQPSKMVTFGFVIQPTNGFAFGDQITIDGGKTFTPHVLSIMPTPGVWTRVKLDVTFTPATGHASVRLDDKDALMTDVSGVTPDGSPLLLNIGANATGPIFPCAVDFDNVTFDPDL